MSKSTQAIQLAILYIKEDNVRGLEKVLKAMPLEKLRDGADKLLSVFLSVCAKYDRPRQVKIILSEWGRIYPVEQNIQLLSKLFTINEIDLPTLAYVVLSHNDYTYVEVMDDLMADDNSPEIVTACNKADQIFGPQPYNTYKIIKEHAEEMRNWRVEEYAIASMEEIAPYADIPTWVKNFTEGEIPKESELYVPKTGIIPFEIPPDEEAVEKLTAGLSHLGISSDDIERSKDYLLQQLSISTKQEKINILRPIIENQAKELLGGDTGLFRVFGPANPLVNQDLTLPGKSNLYGGCRMFLCDVFDFSEEYQYVEDWYTGVCDTCHLRIRHRWHAIRKPRAHGGWVGCFCTWDCVRQSMIEYEEEPDLLTRELINIFEEEINKIGIQDRIPDTLL